MDWIFTLFWTLISKKFDFLQLSPSPLGPRTKVRGFKVYGFMRDCIWNIQGIFLKHILGICLIYFTWPQIFKIFLARKIQQ